MLEHDLKMACTHVQENWFRIDGEIDEKHALQIYQNNCGSDIVLHYSVSKLNACIIIFNKKN